MKQYKRTKKQKADDAARAAECLRESFPKGSKVFCHVDSVARSGMSRRIQFYQAGLDQKGQPFIFRCSYLVANLLDWPLNDDGVRVDGSGMDMGFHAVSCVSYALYGDGYALSHAWI